MGTRTKPPADALSELEELLARPETREEREALDKLWPDPEVVLRQARRRAEKLDEPPKL